MLVSREEGMKGLVVESGSGVRGEVPWGQRGDDQQGVGGVEPLFGLETKRRFIDEVKINHIFISMSRATGLEPRYVPLVGVWVGGVRTQHTSHDQWSVSYLRSEGGDGVLQFLPELRWDQTFHLLLVLLTELSDLRTRTWSDRRPLLALVQDSLREPHPERTVLAPSNERDRTQRDGSGHTSKPDPTQSPQSAACGRLAATTLPDFQSAVAFNAPESLGHGGSAGRERPGASVSISRRQTHPEPINTSLIPTLWTPALHSVGRLTVPSPWQ